MDARSFGMFLKEKLIKEAQKFEANLLSVNYDNLLEAKRNGGIRDTMVGIAQSIDPVLKEFYDQKGHSLPLEGSHE